MTFHRWGNGTRAVLYGISWGPGAMRIPTARRKAVELALLLLKVQRIEGLTREDNTNARKSMEALGMKYCGRLPGALCYNGVATDAVWFELDRTDFGLEPL